MKKLTVFITGSEKRIYLKESIICSVDSYILLKKAYIFWEMINVTKDSFYKFNKGFSKKLNKGYYTFQDIKETLESNDGVKITFNIPRATCSILMNSTTTLILHSSLSSLLGFTDTVFLPGSETFSNTVNVNSGLKYLRVTCDIIDASHNLENGEKSNVLVSLPAMSTRGYLVLLSHFEILSQKLM